MAVILSLDVEQAILTEVISRNKTTYLTISEWQHRHKICIRDGNGNDVKVRNTEQWQKLNRRRQRTEQGNIQQPDFAVVSEAIEEYHEPLTLSAPRRHISRTSSPY